MSKTGSVPGKKGENGVSLARFLKTAREMVQMLLPEEGRPFQR